ncbi:hypothetical protein [Pseudoxanthomonas sp. PXM02]|uniref:hypothetical protein n=1 Tax=Pseudoxanthomonas sp. PXM02 TaxID=2769294 RepID=UPI00177F7FFF|nr:hypothetical protein [Pseudoxanthomonas sp. PXM02]MBD9480135.1 hypothetical protein [Pseudoxanthomonas sp. PXM02]
MNLEELGQKIRAVSADPAVQGVADQLAAWKDSPATADELSMTMERYIGNVWIGSDSDHQQVLTLWSAFQKSSIEVIRGMTMNERLYSFSLLDRFESLQSDGDRQALYAKLLAGVA